MQLIYLLCYEMLYNIAEVLFGGFYFSIYLPL